MISSYGEEVLEILKVVNEGKETKGKDLLTLKQMTKVEGMSAVFEKTEDDLKTIRHILKVIVDNPRFGKSQDNEFIIEALTLAEEFFSGILYNNKGFDTDSYVKIINFTRILTNQILSSISFIGALKANIKRVE